MNVINLQDYRDQVMEKRPRIITFHSPIYQDIDGTSTSFNIRVHVEDGDVFGILEHVIENSGIGEIAENGIYIFIPWPCAAVRIEDA